MTYFFCRFRGYMLVVLATNEKRVLDRLVEYIRVTKGNLHYPEDEIRREAKINTIDLIDDVGHLSKLDNIGRELEKIRKEFNFRLDEKLREVERLKEALRNVANQILDNEDW